VTDLEILAVFFIGLTSLIAIPAVITDIQIKYFKKKD